MSLGALPAPASSSSSSPASSASLEDTLKALVARMEAIERKNRPPTPHPVRVLAGSGPSGGARSQSVADYLGSGAGRVPSLGAEAKVDGDDDLYDVDDGDQQPPLAPAASTSTPTTSAAAPVHPLHGRLAPSVLEDLGSSSFRDWLRTEAPQDSWNNPRNLREVTVLADAMDALVNGDSDGAMEILVRRFLGVRHADIYGNWNYAAALSADLPRRTLLRPSVLSAVLREAKNLSLLENRQSSGRGGGSGTGGGRGRGRGRGRGNSTSSAAATSATPSSNEARQRTSGGGNG